MNIKKEYSAKLLDWFWQYGSKREGAYTLSRGGWLDRALQLIDDYDAVSVSRTRFSKPTMALWGPSQSGKSTLLACFIDAGAGEDGRKGALCWHADKPALFCGKAVPGGPAILNPFNKGADASGCVTRFRLQDEVRYPEHPVELEFATEQALLLSLAVGYLSEVDTKNKKGDVVHWQPGDMADIADEITRNCRSNTPDKAAFLLLVTVLNVVDILIDMEFPRYINLGKEWKNRRSSLLSNDKLVSSIDNVRRFAEEILWDSKPNLSEVAAQLSSKRASLTDKGCRYFCSIEVASLMLNIASAGDYQDSEAIRTLVNSLSLTELAPGEYAVTGGQGRGTLFANEVDFALTQGLVSLIVVPLRRSVMKAEAPAVAALMENAELVDFPGVANEYKAADSLQDEQLALDWSEQEGGKKPLLALTQVMKRGKTASIVVSSARNLNIDVFSLLARMPAGSIYPAHPRQLMDGIRCWFKSMGQSVRPQLSREKRLKINLVLTFSAQLLNLVQASGMGATGLKSVFEKLLPLRDLASPDVVESFCINYPQFPDGVIQVTEQEELRRLVEEIFADPFFRKQFPNTADSLAEMADLEEGRFGGRIYLFERMAEQLRSTERTNLLAEKERAVRAEWESCISDALPPVFDDAEGNKQLQDIDRMLDALRAPTMPFKELAAQVLSFENVDAEVLEAMPMNRSGNDMYCRNQISLWIESARRQELQQGLGFESVEHRSRILSYLAERLQETDADGQKSFCRWVNQLPTTHDRYECLERRRLVATYMVNKLFPIDSGHKSEEKCIAELNTLGDDHGRIGDRTSPYSRSVVEPFIRTLEKLHESVTDTGRPPQPGDDELAAIVAE